MKFSNKRKKKEKDNMARNENKKKLKTDEERIIGNIRKYIPIGRTSSVTRILLMNRLCHQFGEGDSSD